MVHFVHRVFVDEDVEHKTLPVDAKTIQFYKLCKDGIWRQNVSLKTYL